MQSALSHAAAAAPVQQGHGRQTPRRPARLAARVACSAVQTATEAGAATGAVKLPATHLASSAAALQQLKASSGNRECARVVGAGQGWGNGAQVNHPLPRSGYGSPLARRFPAPARLTGRRPSIGTPRRARW